MADKQLRAEQIEDLDTSKVTSGTFADARIAESNVTQHEGSIDALNLTNAPAEAGATADQTDAEIETAINNQLTGTVVGTTDTQDLENKTYISSINAQTGTTYTLVASDASKVVTCTNASAITVTVPDSTFAAGEKVMIVQGGAGSVTLSAGTGVTLNNPSSVDLEIAEENGARVVLFTSASEATVI